MQFYRDASGRIRPPRPWIPVDVWILWQIYRYGDSDDLLDYTGKSVLRKRGLPLTRRNALLYITGGWTSAVCTILAAMLFFSHGPQEFLQLPLTVRLAESASPAFVPALLFFATRRHFPALAVSLRYNAVVLYLRALPLLIAYNFWPYVKFLWPHSSR
jgi:hypothetical protein